MRGLGKGGRAEGTDAPRSLDCRWDVRSVAGLVPSPAEAEHQSAHQRSPRGTDRGCGVIGLTDLPESILHLDLLIPGL